MSWSSNRRRALCGGGDAVAEAERLCVSPEKLEWLKREGKGI